MKIVERSAAELIPAEYNPRELTEDQFEQIKASIQRFGMVDPIIVNKNKDRKDIIIGGHQRVKVATRMGIDKVPTVELDLTLEQEKELNVRLNKNTGRWNFDLLANHFDPSELLSWGFNETELSFFDAAFEEEPNMDDEFDAARETYENNAIKQIILYFDGDQYEDVLTRLDKVIEKEDLEDNSQALIKLLEAYEQAE